MQMSAAPMASALPDVSSVSAANAVGVIEYCMRHELVSSVVADLVLRPLISTPGLRASADYAAGRTGHILTHGKSFAIGQTHKHLRSELCDRVLRQAQRL